MKRVSWFSRKPSIAFALSMLVVCLLPLACGWIFYSQSAAVVREQQENIVRQSLQQSMQQFDSDLQDIMTTSLTMRRKLSKLHMPDEDDFTNTDRIRFFETRQFMFSILENANPAIKSVYLIRPDTDYALTPDAMLSRKILYNRYYRPYGVTEQEFSLLHFRYEQGALVNPHYSRPVFLMSTAQDNKTLLPGKQLVIVLSENYFPMMMENFHLSGISCSLTDQEGKEIFSHAAPPEGKITTFSLPSRFGNYKLIAQVPSSYFYTNSSMLRVLYLSMFFATLLVCGLLIFGLTRRNAMPINKIISYIQDNYTTLDESNVEGLNLIQYSVEEMLKEYNAHRQELRDYQEKEETHILGNTLLGLNKELKGETAAFVVACFSLEEKDDPEEIKSAVLKISDSFRYVSRCVFLSGGLYLLIRKKEGNLTEDNAASFLESMLESLDESEERNLCCAMSAVHASAEEIEVAYQEATMAWDCLEWQSDMPVMRFDTIRYAPEYFLRDFHHLDKQMAFAEQMYNQEYDLAQTTLSSLFPDEFMNDNESVLSRLHLDSLKFQFLHDLTGLLRDSTPDSDELNRINARNILSCTTHAELKELMRDIITELNTLPTPPKETQDMQINEIKTYIRNHSWDPQLSVSSVAEAFNLSSNTLSKLFSRKANMGILQYIHKIRIENACSLLLEDHNTTIADIASQVGYASTLTFNRSFKARYHMNPSEYRRLHRNDE